MKIYRLKRRKARDLSKERRRRRAIVSGPGLTFVGYAKMLTSGRYEDPGIKAILEALNKPPSLFRDGQLSEHLMPTGSGIPEEFKRALAAARAAFRRLHNRSWLN